MRRFPDSESVAVQRGVGSVPRYVAAERTPVTPTCGRVRSMLIGLTTTVVAPPSVAVIVLVTDCPAPSPDSGTADGHAPVKAAPCVVQVNFTLTGIEYQPSPLLGLLLDT